MISEKPAGFGKRINSWRLDVVHPVTAKLRPQVIDGDEENVGLVRRNLGDGGGSDEECE